jgi:hypothetical protein
MEKRTYEEERAAGASPLFPKRSFAKLASPRPLLLLQVVETI